MIKGKMSTYMWIKYIQKQITFLESAKEKKEGGEKYKTFLDKEIEKRKKELKNYKEKLKKEKNKGQRCWEK
jgi:hypothetical protein